MHPSTDDQRGPGVAALFDRVAATYENVGVPWFGPIGAELVRVLAPEPGERAVDLGCGRGATLFPLADAVGPTGRVTGIDLSPGMLAHLEADVRARGLATVDLHLMDAGAPTLPPASYDLAVSSLVLFFLPDPVAALRAWRRLLVPGGRLGLTTFGEQDPVWQDVDSVFRPYVPAGTLEVRTGTGAGPFGSEAGTTRLVESAGFAGVLTARFDVPVVFDGPEQWRVWSWSHGQRAMWDAVPEADRDRVLAAATARLEAARGPDGRITFTQRVRLTLAETTG